MWKIFVLCSTSLYTSATDFVYNFMSVESNIKCDKLLKLYTIWKTVNMERIKRLKYNLLVMPTSDAQFVDTKIIGLIPGEHTYWQRHLPNV